MPTSIRRPRALSRKAARLAASSAIALSVAAGATLATAPTASALDSTHCTKNITNQWRTVRDLAGAAVRSGPGQTYTKRYGLDMGKHFWAVCQATSNRKGWIVASKTGKGKY
ncbi:hypothetical protein AB0D58_27235 [Streptomyces sp. NPDC048210]|uniref:hypothetical protein n=1 Tax=Streptomyces sp. NPDC048210 TaxID=3156657 RepID=UPI00342FCF24